MAFVAFGATLVTLGTLATLAQARARARLATRHSPRVSASAVQFAFLGAFELARATRTLASSSRFRFRFRFRFGWPIEFDRLRPIRRASSSDFDLLAT